MTMCHSSSRDQDDVKKLNLSEVKVLGLDDVPRTLRSNGGESRRMAPDVAGAVQSLWLIQGHEPRPIDTQKRKSRQ